MKPSQLSRRRYQHLCVFGDPKTGKSTMVSKLIKAGFSLTWVSMDNGHEVIFKLRSEGVSAEQLDERLNIIVIPDTKESPIAVKTCAAIMSGRPAVICDTHGISGCSACKSKGGTFTTIDTSQFGAKDILVFDHLGQLANSTMNILMLKMKDEDKPEWEDYRVQGTLMDKFLVNVQQANFNVICISHPAEIKMEDGSKKLVPVIGSDNFSRNSGKYFDHLVYVEVSSGKHRFGSHTTYKASVLTGSRSDVVIDATGSLVPFFDGTIAPPEEQGVSAAASLLSKSAPVVAVEELVSSKQEREDDDRAAEVQLGLSERDTAVIDTATQTGRNATQPVEAEQTGQQPDGSKDSSRDNSENKQSVGSGVNSSAAAKPTGSPSTLALLARLKGGK